MNLLMVNDSYTFRMDEPYFVTTIFRSTLHEEVFALKLEELNNALLSGLNEKQILLYRYVVEKGPVSSGDYAKVIGKTDRTVRNYMYGSIRGIAGNAIKAISLLELPAGEEGGGK